MWRGSAGLVLTGAVVLAAVLGTLQLKHVGEHGFQEERDLQAVTAELQIQNGLEWRAISGRELPSAIAAEFAASVQRAEQLTTRVYGGEVEAEERALLDAQRAYADAVAEELRLLTIGAHAAAEEWDESVVDPAFERALEGLTEHATEEARAAARARSFSDTGLVGILALSLGLTALLQGRRRFAEVRRRAERQSEARYRTLVDQASDLVVVTDRHGHTSYLSPSAERLFAATAEPGLDLAHVVHPGDRDRLAAALASTAPGDAALVDIRMGGSGAWRTLAATIQDLTEDPSIGGLVLTGHDITDRQALQDELEHRAMHDALTGLPNRALLARRIAAALDDRPTGRGVIGLLLIDLDRFKEINDTLGHHVGDELLVQVGRRLAGEIGTGDTVARLGGDEFAVLLASVHGLDAAAAVADRVRAAVARPFRVDGVDLDVEASIGLVVSGEHGDDAGVLMQRADIAMYHAKQRGLGVFAYQADVDTHSPERLALLGDLRRAIDSDQLFLQYQPKVSLNSGQVCGAEALLRWRHPARGLIPPGDFVPLAENTGLIGPLTRRVLALAIAQGRRWQDAGRPLQVAVNLSARNLLDDDLVDVVAELLSAHRIGPELLRLEVTESAIMADPQKAQELLHRLHDAGVEISIDDFGAGYTSLAQLRHLPVSELKIDRSFIAGMDSAGSDSLIVRSVISLGHNLGLRAVAEGVETAETLRQLTDIRCDIAQGFHLARPLDADAFDAWMQEWARSGLSAGPSAPVPAPRAV